LSSIFFCFLDEDEAQRLVEDPMYKLEHDVEDKKKATLASSILEELQEQSLDHWKDDYASSQLVRKKFREEKKLRLLEEEKDASLIKRTGLAIPLVQEQQTDVHLAQLIPFASRDGKCSTTWKISLGEPIR
jgi:coiled-coil domain-containing protein 130